jgi:hypothetical protein
MAARGSQETGTDSSPEKPGAFIFFVGGAVPPGAFRGWVTSGCWFARGKKLLLRNFELCFYSKCHATLVLATFAPHTPVFITFALLTHVLFFFSLLLSAQFMLALLLSSVHFYRYLCSTTPLATFAIATPVFGSLYSEYSCPRYLYYHD